MYCISLEYNNNAVSHLNNSENHDINIIGSTLKDVIAKAKIYIKKWTDKWQSEKNIDSILIESIENGISALTSQTDISDKYFSSLQISYDQRETYNVDEETAEYFKYEEHPVYQQYISNTTRKFNITKCVKCNDN